MYFTKEQANHQVTNKVEAKPDPYNITAAVLFSFGGNLYFITTWE